MIVMPSAPETLGAAVEPVVLVPPPSEAAPTAEDVGRFEAALVPPRVVIQDLDAFPPPIEPAVITPGTLGDRILTSVDQMRVEYRAGMERMDTAARKEDVRMPDMMRMMVDAMQMGLQQEMLSKMVGRTTQNLDSLLKGQ